MPFSVTHLTHWIFVLNSVLSIVVSMLNSSTITVIWWWNLDMETSDSLDIVFGGFGVVSFYAKLSVVLLECSSLFLDVVGVDGVYGVDSMFDWILKVY